MKLTLVTLDVSYDAYYIIFVDGKKFDEGDDYHTKLSYKFEGIKEFLKFSNIPCEVQELDFNTKGDGAYYDHDHIVKENENLDAFLKRIKKFMIKK
jgi:hypothetical protein